MEVVISKSTNKNKNLMLSLMVKRYHLVKMEQVILLYTKTLNVKNDTLRVMLNVKIGKNQD